jgi:hypothetical protein
MVCVAWRPEEGNMKSCISLAACFWMILGGSSLAVDCQSAGGHIGGQPASVVRQVTLQGDQLSLTGGFDHSSVLSCTPLAPGLFCQGEVGRMQATVIVNGSSLLESIADTTSHKEWVGLSYVCDRSLELAAR